MRAVLVNGIPWEEEKLKSLPMVKEMEALDRLPGDYIVAESTTEVTKAGGGALSPGEARFAEKWKKARSLKQGGRISISKEMCGDPAVLWNIVEDREENKKVVSSILVQPVEHKCVQRRDGTIVAEKWTTVIGGFRLQRWSFFHSDGMIMKFFEGTIAIDGFSMVLLPLNHHH